MDTNEEEFVQIKLKKLFCDTHGKFDGNTFHIIVTNGLERELAQEEMMTRFAFLKGIDYKAVYDFDPTGQLFRFMEENLHENMTIYKVDEFDPASPQNERTKTVFQDTDVAHQNMWIIANGNKHMHIDALDIRKWNQQRSEGFKELTRKLKNAMPSGRVTVVFMVLSSEYALMKKMSDELCLRFGDNWCVIAENGTDVEKWQTYMTENICDDDELDEKRLVGIPWETINTQMLHIVGSITEPPFELPSSREKPEILHENVKKEWVDIDVLPANHGKFLLGQDREKQKQVSEDYFRGAAVDWGNFAYRDVLKRTEFTRLLSHVRKVLQFPHNSGSYVKIVTLYHEPGAGGTSTASQVLWELKDEYRCAVVKNIKQSQTSEEISNFHKFKDDTPKPVLLLFDNQDEEGVSTLKAELEDKAKMFGRHAKSEQLPVFYVFLQCVRQTSVKKTEKTKPAYFAVKQELDKEEKRLFREKGQLMEKRFEENEPYSINPANMISFNVMKNGFDPEYTENIVESLLEAVKNPREIMLLKFVSLLNSFDLSFRALPLTVFDHVMVPELRAKQKVPAWEQELSQPAKILLYITRKRKDCKRVRVSHNTLSQMILCKLLQKAKSSKQMFYDVVHEFLDHPGIFNREIGFLNQYVRFVLRVVCEIVKKRRRDGSTGYPETKFASLIESIKDEGGNEQAAGVLKKVYDLSNDLFVGQQLARFYIHVKNWTMARNCAEELVKKNQRNSYLLDTLGQTYKQEVYACFEEVVEQDSLLQIPKARHIMSLAFKAISIFQRAQKLTEHDTESQQNVAGYCNELITIAKLLDSLALVEVLKSPGILQALLLGRPVEKEVLEVFEGDHIKEVQKLQGYVMKTTIKLKDEFQQLKVDWGNEVRERNVQYGKSTLKRCTEHLSVYFVCLLDNPRNEEEKCENRRTKTKQLSGYTFKDMLKLGEHKDETGRANLSIICQMMEKNMQSKSKNSSDLQTYLSAKLSLCMFDQEGIDLQEMARLSLQLYRDRKSSDIPKLEPYLFVTMLNWPQQHSGRKMPVSISEIREIVTQWKAAYYDKHPRQRELGKPHRKRDTTVAFLGDGEGMSRFVFHRVLVEGDRFNEYVGEFWERPEVVERLDRWPGVLINDGCDVSFQIQQGEFQEKLEIPTSFPVNKPRWYRKKVFVVVGFTWAGPRAFDVRREDPRIRASTEASDACDVRDDSLEVPEERAQLTLRLPAKFNTKEFAERLHKTQEQLDKIHKLKTLPHKDRNKEDEDMIRNEFRLRQDLTRLRKDKQKNLDKLSADIEGFGINLL